MIRLGVAVGALGMLASIGHAQWTPTKIGFWGPFNYVSIKGATSAGFGGYGAPDYASDFHALYWKTGDQAFTDLNPVGFYNSYITRCVGDYQYGYGMTMDGNFHALRWQGTAESAVDLHPGGIWTNSQIMGASREDTVGICRTGFSDPAHAALWSGSTSNFVDLTPTGADGATPYACSPNNQVGVVSYAFKNHAALWHGTAESMVDLNPAWSDHSFGLYASGNVQGGLTYIHDEWGGLQSRATIWHGSAESAIDLTEPGYFSSNLSDMNGQYQVGTETKFISPYQYSHAVVWQGTAESAFDLQPSLSSITSGIQGSGALAVTEDGDIIGAVGSADGNFLVKWTHAVPEPTTILGLGIGLAVLARRRRRS